MIRSDFKNKDSYPEKKPKFKPGKVVTHIRYSYRGVVVDYDLTCKAHKNWYESNKTQPPKNQPWYHLLVDGAQHMTYVAESHLKLDTTGAKINHSLIEYFFVEYKNGIYLRNDTPLDGWPEEED